MDERFVFAQLGLKHRLADGGFDFLFVVANYAAVAFDNGLYHRVILFLLVSVVGACNYAYCFN